MLLAGAIFCRVYFVELIILGTLLQQCPKRAESRGREEDEEPPSTTDKRLLFSGPHSVSPERKCVLLAEEIDLSEMTRRLSNRSETHYSEVP